jgi:hypothetical protein
MISGEVKSHTYYKRKTYRWPPKNTGSSTDYPIQLEEREDGEAAAEAASGTLVVVTSDDDEGEEGTPSSSF